MKYREICFKYNAVLKKLYFTAVSSAFSIDFLRFNELASEFQTPVTLLLVGKNTVWVFIFLVRSQGIFW